MAEPTEPQPSTATAPPRLSPNGTVPPMPFEANEAPAHPRPPAAPGRFRRTMAPLRRMIRRTPRRP